MRRALAASVLVVLLAATGAQASSPALSESAYRAKANAICANLNNYQPPAGSLTVVFGAVLGKAHDEYTALKKLSPPDALAKGHGRVLAVISRGLTKIDGLYAGLKSGKLTPAKFRAAIEAISPAQESSLWKKLGVKTCAQ